MNKRPIDKTKKSNIKCEHCKFFKESDTYNYGIVLTMCINKTSIKYNGNVNYWNRCKRFEWENTKEDL